MSDYTIPFQAKIEAQRQMSVHQRCDCHDCTHARLAMFKAEKPAVFISPVFGPAVGGTDATTTSTGYTLPCGCWSNTDIHGRKTEGQCALHAETAIG